MIKNETKTRERDSRVKTKTLKKMLMSATAAVIAFGIAAPAQAATEFTKTITYHTVNWNGLEWKVPVIRYIPVPEPAQQTPAQPAEAPMKTENQPVEITDAEVKKIVELVNAERAKAGLAPLTLDLELTKMAAAKAEDMRDNNYFSHESPVYGSPFEMMNAFGIRYSYAGENIAAGQRTPEEVMEAWMNSPGHRANILNENYTHIGIGAVKGGSYGTYWVQSFMKP